MPTKVPKKELSGQPVGFWAWQTLGSEQEKGGKRSSFTGRKAQTREVNRSTWNTKWRNPEKDRGREWGEHSLVMGRGSVEEISLGCGRKRRPAP